MKCHICIYWTPETGCDHYEPSFNWSAAPPANFTHRHKHCPLIAEIISVCANGSWKIKVLDTTRRSKKTKTDYVPNFCKDQWERIPK